MVSRAIIFASVATFLAIYFQSFFNDLIFVFFGVGRTVQPIEDFPYSCRRIYHELLQSCEHMWLDDEGRRLYGACTDMESRRGWLPNMKNLNSSARTLNDRIVVLDIDKPGKDGLYAVDQLKIVGDYSSAEGGKNIDVLAFSVEILPDSTRRFYIINHRLPLDNSGKPLDAQKVGANSTFEVFDLAKGSKELTHVKTIVSPAIVSPNSVTVIEDGGFIFTNDHGRKTGLRFELDVITGGGNVGICTSSSGCHIAAGGFKFPNGIVRGKDGLFYIVHSASGKVTVHSLQPNGTLLQTNEIKLWVALDNLSIDANGDIFVAAMPDMLENVKAWVKPDITDPPAAVWRIRNVGEGYEVKKVLEDNGGKILPIATVAVHDAMTGRLFLGAIDSDFITVCEPKP